MHEIIWVSDFYNSIERCTIAQQGDGWAISSTIAGTFEENLFKIDYNLHANNQWQILSATIQTFIEDTKTNFQLEKTGDTVLLNGNAYKGFNNISYIDISLTAFTNTLPINGLHLKNGETRVIDVIYFDIFEKKVSAEKQFYTRVSSDHYIFETFDKSFKADLDIDEDGLVTNYPGLFEMKIKR